VKDEKIDLVAESYNIVDRWRNYFSQLLNLNGINDIKPIDTLTIVPLVAEPSIFEFELAIEKPKSHKSPGFAQITAELFRVAGRTICH
jgi:hypothetical protein